ncbi:enoyl-CoA hydratase-related protein [Alicyclobacillus mali (ex Roth et al. 2021)]|uniref:enoyl-CoA hydratase-related protein n=1 Tax=Alicyclobacillus mali (ex Roth et al. 2021) TaxID=1123961 RepID=UPI000831D426|nr:enoyl-CoA hydratase-related protein [Alicyclobacillus mali (ex Roth et al. 2021)]MCL6489328.1 enoyl-CoA hydratase/isomerase family protein [Alicyclobacillus mali (ex Roth et al. 2021)]
MHESVRVEHQGAVMVVTLHRPEKVNALTRDTLFALREAFQAAGEDGDVRSVLLTGAGRGFCAGQDLDLGGGDADYAKVIRETYNPLILTMTHLEKPIVCAINGVAAGAGVSLALACDLRIASESATFIQAFVNIGLIPDSGGTWFLPRIVGLGRAMELAMLGDRVDASRAYEMGLVNRVVPVDRLMAEAMGLAERLASMPTRAIGLVKRAHYEGMEQTLAQSLELEAVLQKEAGQTADHQEGVRAFLEKRPPRFQGR